MCFGRKQEKVAVAAKVEEGYGDTDEKDR